MSRSSKKKTERKAAIFQDEFSVGRNRLLRYAYMKPQITPVRGTVIFLQDWGQPVETCSEVLRSLAERGFHSTSFDWFDVGYSASKAQGRTVYPLDNFRFDPGKLNTFLQDVILPDFPPPFFVLAQRIGGLFAMSTHNWLLNQIRRMVIISPQLEMRGRQAGSLYHYYLRLMITLGLESRRWHRKAIMDEAFSGETDSEVMDGNPHWSKSILDSIARVTSLRYCEQMAVPTLFVTSNHDPRSDPSKTRKLSNQLRFAQTVSISGASPDILGDHKFYSNQFWAVFDAFIPGTGAQAMGRLLEDSMVI